MGCEDSTDGTNGKSGHSSGGALAWKPRVPLFDSPACPVGPPGATRSTQGEDTGQREGHKPISRTGEDMLIMAKREPLTLTALYRRLALSGYMGQKTKQELIRGGLVVEVELPTNRRGRRKKLLEATPRGNKYLTDLGITTARKGRGGVRHLHYQQLLKDWYESHGYTVEIEARVGETTFDVLVIDKRGDRLGIEIATTLPYEGINAQKGIASGVERLLFVCESEIMEPLQRKVAAAVEGKPGPRPGFKLVTDYMTDEEK